MALITNFTAFDAFRLGEELTTVKIGNNRTVTVTIDHKGTVTAECRLHGHLIVSAQRGGAIADGYAQIQINDCGYVTNTTREAINDFLRGLNVGQNASIAGGFLSVDGHVKRMGTIDFCARLGSGFTAGRYAVTMAHDKGRARITIWADNHSKAVDLVCKAEGAPRSAAIKVQESR